MIRIDDISDRPLFSPAGQRLRLSLAGICGVAALLAGGPVTVAMGAAEERGPDRTVAPDSAPRLVAAQEIQQRLGALQALRLERQELLRQQHERQAVTERRRIELQTALDRAEVELAEATARRQEAEADQARRDGQARALQAQWERVRVALEPQARAAAERVTGGIPFERAERSASFTWASEPVAPAPRDAAGTVDTHRTASPPLTPPPTPDTQLQPLRAYLQQTGDDLAAARQITLASEAILLAEGRQQLHAWVVRVGLVSLCFVSEDGAQVGLWSGDPAEPWRLAVSAEERQQIETLLAVARGRQAPALTTLPVPVTGVSR